MRTLEEIFDDINRFRTTVEQELNYYKGVDDDFMQWHIKRFQKVWSEVNLPEGRLSIGGTPIVSKCTRVVTGGHGPYVEFTEKDLLFTPVTEKKQEWRAEKKYENCKYLWLTHPDLKIKIYKQKHGVRYADYKPGMYYIDAIIFDGVTTELPKSPVIKIESEDPMDLL